MGIFDLLSKDKGKIKRLKRRFKDVKDEEDAEQKIDEMYLDSHILKAQFGKVL